MLLIEVVVPLSSACIVEATFVQCCIETGDEFLGRKAYREIDEMLLVVRLAEEGHYSLHIPTLTKALRQRVISSYQFVQGHVVKLTSKDILAQMRGFPLAMGDSWIPSAYDIHIVYLCMPRLFLTSEQTAWFMQHEDVTWDYVQDASK